MKDPKIVLELPLMVDSLVTYRPCVGMSILKDDELPATFVSRPNPRARKRGEASNVRIGPRSGLCSKAEQIARSSGVVVSRGHDSLNAAMMLCEPCFHGNDCAEFHW